MQESKIACVSRCATGGRRRSSYRRIYLSSAAPAVAPASILSTLVVYPLPSSPNTIMAGSMLSALMDIIEANEGLRHGYGPPPKDILIIRILVKQRESRGHQSSYPKRRLRLGLLLRLLWRLLSRATVRLAIRRTFLLPI